MRQLICREHGNWLIEEINHINKASFSGIPTQQNRVHEDIRFVAVGSHGIKYTCSFTVSFMLAKGNN